MKKSNFCKERESTMKNKLYISRPLANFMYFATLTIFIISTFNLILKSQDISSIPLSQLLSILFLAFTFFIVYLLTYNTLKYGGISRFVLFVMPLTVFALAIFLIKDISMLNINYSITVIIVEMILAILYSMVFITESYKQQSNQTEFDLINKLVLCLDESREIIYSQSWNVEYDENLYAQKSFNNLYDLFVDTFSDGSNNPIYVLYQAIDSLQLNIETINSNLYRVEPKVKDLYVEFAKSSLKTYTNILDMIKEPYSLEIFLENKDIYDKIVNQYQHDEEYLDYMKREIENEENIKVLKKAQIDAEQKRKEAEQKRIETELLIRNKINFL